MTRPSVVRPVFRPALRRAVLVLAVLAVAGPLAACGKKGKLEPPDKDSPYPQTYPTSK